MTMKNMIKKICKETTLMRNMMMNHITKKSMMKKWKKRYILVATQAIWSSYHIWAGNQTFQEERMARVASAQVMLSINT
jgi:predicted SAM-dependent methyltransferase